MPRRRSSFERETLSEMDDTMQCATSVPSPLVGEGREGGLKKTTPLRARSARPPPPQEGRQQNQCRRWMVVTLLAAALIAGAHVLARADNYPSKTITIIAPASPGGVTDLLARI